MNTKQPLRLQPAATPEVRSLERHAYDPAKDAALEDPARPDTLAGPSVKVGADREWRWPQTLRLAIIVSGLFWLIVGLCVWMFLNAG